MRKTQMTKSALVLAGVLAFGAGIAAKAADYVILDSNAAGIEPGLVIADSADITVPEGATLVLISPSGETLAIKGPYSGMVSEAAQSADGSAIDRLITTRERDTKVLGAVRSPMIGGGSVRE